MYADENVIKIKHDVLYTVAKLAFEGRLEEERDHIATELIPGPTPQFPGWLLRADSRKRETISRSN